MQKFLKPYKWPNLTKEKLKHLSIPIFIDYIKFASKNLSTKESPGTAGHTDKFSQAFKEDICPTQTLSENKKAGKTSLLIV